MYVKRTKTIFGYLNFKKLILSTFKKADRIHDSQTVTRKNCLTI